jgi:hypothetical protein
MISSENTKALTANFFLQQLQQRVSKGNAKLLLDTAKIQTGLKFEDEASLSMEDSKTLCLVMIKQGGPSFQVGQSIYKEYLM